MSMIFNPSVNLINRLKYPQKLMLMGAIVIFVVLALMYELSKQAFYQIHFSEKEILGVELNNPLISLMRKIQYYRTVSNRVDNNLAKEDERRFARLAVDQEIIAISELFNQVSPKINLVDRWNQVKNEWESIKLSKENIGSYGRNTDLMPNLQSLISSVCDNSNLTLDPQMDTYYLIDAYCNILPQFIENVKNIQDLGTTSLNTKSISAIDLDYLHVTTSITTRYFFPSINEDIGKAIERNPSLSSRFSSLSKLFNQNTNLAFQTLNSTVLNENFDFSIDKFNLQFSNVTLNADQLSSIISTTIVELLQHRIKGMKEIFYLNLAVVTLGLLIFIYLFIGVYLSIIQSVRQLVSGSEEIAKGNLKAKVSLNTKDELSHVADSFNKMRVTLRGIVDELHKVVTAVARGNLNQHVNLSDKEGFGKELSININTMIDVFNDMVKDMITVLGYLSKGNLTIRVTREYHGIFADLKKYVNSTVDDLENLILNIKKSTETIRGAAEEISIGNFDLEKRTEQQAASLEVTSMSMSKLTETIKENSENAKEAHGFVQATSNVVEESGRIVNQMVEMMTAINESARQINEITNVIDNIAFQTNILALNAAVEAARAGEQGRGFSVVASEIRNLAQRSSLSAQGIKTLISSSVEQVSQGKKLADESGKTMKQVIESIQSVTRIMSEIASASVQQTEGIQQINSAIEQMDHVTQQNSNLVEEAARSSESLKNQTEQMNELVNVFKISEEVISKEKIAGVKNLNHIHQKIKSEMKADIDNENPAKNKDTENKDNTGNKDNIENKDKTDGWTEF